MSLVWNILNKFFPGRKVPRGRTESAVPPLDSTLALPFLERRDCGVEECINFAYSLGWAAPFFDDENNKNYCNFVAF